VAAAVPATKATGAMAIAVTVIPAASRRRELLVIE
jgi:hypothetical protein